MWPTYFYGEYSTLVRRRSTRRYQPPVDDRLQQAIISMILELEQEARRYRQYAQDKDGMSLYWTGREEGTVLAIQRLRQLV